jgi:nucleolar complex protein 2
MAKPKSAKKFEKNHLKDTIKRRKDFKNKTRLYSKKPRTGGRDDGSGDEKPTTADAAFENMTVDEFFQTGFDVPEPAKKKRKRGGADATAKTTKKAKVIEEDDESESVEDSDSELDVAPGGVLDGLDDEQDFDSGDDEDTHKKDLAKLAEKDPEFHKFLQENDADLLDFEEDNFDNIQLSDDEEESDVESEMAEDRSLDLATVEKWEKTILELHSLRALKKMILAFRSAAHMNDPDKKDYKYTVTNSDGKFLPDVLSIH